MADFPYGEERDDPVESGEGVEMRVMQVVPGILVAVLAGAASPARAGDDELAGTEAPAGAGADGEGLGADVGASTMVTEVRFELDREFSLGFGQTARGPGDLVIYYAGLGYDISGTLPNPSLVIGKGAATDYPLIAQPMVRRADEIVGRALWKDIAVSILRVEPDREDAVTLVVGSAAPFATPFTYDVPFVLRPYEFAISPEGWVLALGQAVEPAEGQYYVDLQYLGGPAASGWINMHCNPSLPDEAQTGWAEYLIAIEALEPHASGRDSARLRIWKPSEAERPFELGKPFALFPGETGVGPGGLRVTLQGFGHFIKEDRTELPFAFVGLLVNDQPEGVRITMEPGRRDAFGSASVAGHTVTLLNGDGGPPHRGDARIELLVQAE